MVIYWPDDSFYKIISEMLCFHSTRLIPAQVPLTFITYSVECMHLTTVLEASPSIRPTVTLSHLSCGWGSGWGMGF